MHEHETATTTAEQVTVHGHGEQRPSDWWPQFLLVSLAALAPRLVYLFQMRLWPDFLHPILDSRTQWKWAGILVQTHGIGNIEVLAKAPLYPYWLAFYRWLFHDDALGLFAAHAGQFTMGALTCGLTYLLGRRVFGATAGLIAGLVFALYSPGIFRDGQLLDTALATFLATGFLLLFLVALDRPADRWAWARAGLALGLLGVTRPNLLLLAVVAAGCTIAWLRREAGWPVIRRALTVFALTVVLPIALTAGRNYLVTGGFVPISSTGGINLYTGNNPGANGYSPIPAGIAWERTWYQASGERPMRAGDQDRYWRNEAVRFWRERPGAALGLLVKKGYLYWARYEIPNNISYDWGRERASALRLAPFTFGLVAPLGLMGMALGGWRDRRARVLTLSVLAQLVAVAAFFVAGRYRMPAVPLLCAFAGFGVVEFGRMARERRFGRMAIGLAVLGAGALLVHSDAYGVRRGRGANRDWYYIGQAYLLAADQRQAAEAFQRAVEADPTDADAFSLLGRSEVILGRPEAAREHLERALEVAPDYATAAGLLGELYLQQGWPVEEAERLLRRAVEHQFRSVEGLAMLARLSLRRGDLEQARVDLEAAAAALARRSPSDTRTAAAAGAVSRAAMEAEQAGVEIPSGLLRY